ncbi:MAG: hypothetical protein CMM03_17515 [Rhodopirellula sp.]|nr:hypothetical protein [Rhodopirellula sp.]
MKFVVPTLVASIPVTASLTFFKYENFETWLYNIQSLGQIALLWSGIALAMTVLHLTEFLVRIKIGARMYYPCFATASILIFIALGFTARINQDPLQAATLWLYCTPVIFLVLGKFTSHSMLTGS